MLDLISKIIFDLRKNFKPFIIIYIFFISLFFLNDIHKSKVIYKYTSSLILTEPSSISNFAKFDGFLFRRSLHLYISKLDTNALLKMNCSSDTIAKHKIDTNYEMKEFRYVMLEFNHADVLGGDCMKKIYDNEVLTFYNEFLENVIKENKMIIDYLEFKTPIVDTKLYMSTLKESYRKPGLVLYESDMYFKSKRDFSKILIVSFIFSAILTMIISFLYDGKAIKKTLKKYKAIKK